jgi:hypothetical protein
VENFEEFKKIMIKRNKDIERKALSLMLQNEENAMRALLNKKQTTNGRPLENRQVTTQGRGRGNSFSSNGGSSSEDEGLKLALKMSQ